MTKFGELLNERVPVLIYFYADWNVVSMEMLTVLRELAIVLGDRAKILKMDVDKNRDLAKALKIGNLPTTLVYKNKKEVSKIEGELNIKEILNKSNNLLD